MLRNKGVPIPLTAVITVTLFVVGWLMTNTALVTAHNAGTYYSLSWASDPTYSFGDINSPLNTTSAKESIHFGDNGWDFTPNAWLDFHWNYVEDNTVVWQADACATAPSNGVWIITYDFGGDTLGRTAGCVVGNTMTKAVIRMDESRNNSHTLSTDNVPNGKYDLRSVITHEFGHATGFGIQPTNQHFSGTICNGSARQTMCPTLPTGAPYWRDLETHDEHTFASQY